MESGGFDIINGDTKVQGRIGSNEKGEEALSIIDEIEADLEMEKDNLNYIFQFDPEDEKAERGQVTQRLVE